MFQAAAHLPNLVAGEGQVEAEDRGAERAREA